MENKKVLYEFYTDVYKYIFLCSRKLPRQFNYITIINYKKLSGI